MPTIPELLGQLGLILFVASLAGMGLLLIMTAVSALISSRDEVPDNRRPGASKPKPSRRPCDHQRGRSR